MTERLLARDEPAPVTIERTDARSPIVLTCDHASNRIPRALGSLGLDDTELSRHIAWDIGAAGVSRCLSQALDATLVLQNYSRLVIDCNRPRDNDDLMPRLSEATVIPGNRDLDDRARAQRREEIFEPYHRAITDLLDQRADKPHALVSIHSFTPVYLEQARPWHMGILYRRDRRMAAAMLATLAGRDDWCIGENEPYRIDGKDFGIPVHGEARGIPHVLIEIRQDLIATAPQQRALAALLVAPLRASLAAVGHSADTGLL
jgi:predicted N-formylglutamate amidohydrolase